MAAAYLHQAILGTTDDPAAGLALAADAIAAAAEKSAGLTRSLLEFVRDTPGDTISTDVDGAVEERIELLRRTLGERIDLRWSPDGDLPLLLFEPVHLDQILTNLCINARDALQGEGTIEVSTHRVPATELDRWVVIREFVRQPEAEHIALVVRDDGPGMDEDTRRHAFEPFFTTKPRGSGTGLGLSTVYGIVKQYDGVIELHSEPGAGTEVRILLPVPED